MKRELNQESLGSIEHFNTFEATIFKSINSFITESGEELIARC